MEPIPLTEEWLIRFGFEKSTCDEVNIYELESDAHPLFINGDKNGFLEIVLDVKPQVRVRYVHQLQNLYHALTGQELTLTEQP